MASFPRENFKISSFLEWFLKILILSIITVQVKCQIFTYIRTHTGMRSTTSQIENATHICLEDCLLYCDLKPNTLSAKYNEKHGRCTCHSAVPYEMRLQAREHANMYMRLGRSDIPHDCLEVMTLDFKYDREANFCYKRHQEKKSWLVARSECEQEGAVLAKLDTTVKMDIARRLVEEHRGDILIGGTDAVVNGEWRWIADNSIIPNLTNARTKHCLEIQQGTLQMEYVICNQANSFLCEVIME